MKEIEKHIDDISVSLYHSETLLKTEGNIARGHADEIANLQRKIGLMVDSIAVTQNELNNSISLVAQRRRDHGVIQAEIHSMGEDSLRLKEYRCKVEEAVRECRLNISKSSVHVSHSLPAKERNAVLISTIESRISETCQEREILDTTYANYGRELALYRTTLQETKAASELVQRDIKSTMTAIKDSRRALEKRSRIYTESSALLRSSEDNFAHLNSEHAKVSADIVREQQSISDILLTDLVKLTGHRDRVLKQLELTRHETSKLEQLRIECESQAEPVRKEQARFNLQIKELEDAKMLLAQRRAHLSEVIASRSEECLLLISQKSASTNELSQRIKIHKSHKTYILERRHELEKLERQSHETFIARTAAEYDLDSLRRIVGATEKDVHALEADIALTKKDLERRARRSELEQENLNRLKSQVASRIREKEEKLKAHSKNSSSLSLESRVQSITEEIKNVIRSCDEQEAEVSGARCRIEELMVACNDLSDELAEERVKNIIFEKLCVRKKENIQKSNDREEMIIKEVGSLELDYSRIGAIRVKLVSRKQVMNDKLHQTREEYDHDSRLEEIITAVSLNDEIASNIQTLGENIASLLREKCETETKLQKGSKTKLRPVNDDRSLMNELDGVIRSLKRSLKDSTKHLRGLERIAIDSIHRLDIASIRLPRVSSRLSGPSYLGSTCSTLASSSNSLSNYEDKEDSAGSSECDAVEIEIWRLRHELKRSGDSGDNGEGHVSLRQEGIYVLDEVLYKWIVKLPPDIRKQIISWHQFNRRLCL